MTKKVENIYIVMLVLAWTMMKYESDILLFDSLLLEEPYAIFQANKSSPT